MRQEKKRIKKDLIHKIEAFRSSYGNEPKYLNNFHKMTTLAKMKEIEGWKNSPKDLNKILKHQKEFKAKAEQMEKEQYRSFN